MADEPRPYWYKPQASQPPVADEPRPYWYKPQASQPPVADEPRPYWYKPQSSPGSGSPGVAPPAVAAPVTAPSTAGVPAGVTPSRLNLTVDRPPAPQQNLFQDPNYFPQTGSQPPRPGEAPSMALKNALENKAEGMRQAATPQVPNAGPIARYIGGFQQAEVDKGGEAIRQGIQSFKEGNKLAGIGGALGGALQQVFSPFTGAAEALVGEPVRQMTGSEAIGGKASFLASLPITPVPAGKISKPGLAPRAASAAAKPQGYSEIAGGFIGDNPNLTPSQQNAASMPGVQKLMTSKVYGDAVDDALRYATERDVDLNTVSGMAKRVNTLVRNAVNPGAMGDDATRAMGVIRETQGLAEQATREVEASLGQYAKQVSQMDDTQRLLLADYIEGRSKGVQIADPALQGLADTFQSAMQDTRKTLEGLLPAERQKFYEDYMSHMWEDPDKARSFYASKTGSGGFTKERSIATTREGIDAGLKPRTLDPIENAMYYTMNARKFIAMKETVLAGRATGDIKYFLPGKAPPGWAQINERVAGTHLGSPQTVNRKAEFHVPGSEPQGWIPTANTKPNANGGPAMVEYVDPVMTQRSAGGGWYAPEGYAKIINNFASQGFERFGEGPAAALKAVQAYNAMATSMQLGLSAFHGVTMVKQRMMGGFAQAYGEMLAGRPGKAAATAAKSFVSPIAPLVPNMVSKKVLGRSRLDKRVEEQYLGLADHGPEMEKVVDLLTRANARMTPSQAWFKDNNLMSTSQKTFWKSWKDGTLASELKADLDFIKQYPVKGAVTIPAKQVLRAVSSVMEPMFHNMIPALKRSAMYEQMSSFIAANPTATEQELLAAARKIVDVVDNRMGMMNHDNIFWPKTAKQMLQSMMLSFSWVKGSADSYLRGPIDAVKGVTKGAPKLASGEGVKQYNMRGYFLPGAFAGMALTNAAYQYLMTGKPPESLNDLAHPRTGGIIPKTAFEPEKPERARIPGEENQLWDIQKATSDLINGRGLQGFTDFAANKASPAARLPSDLRGKDWRGKPYMNEDMTPMRTEMGALKNLGKEITPFQFQEREYKPGSALNNLPSRLLGINPAGVYGTDPVAYDRMRRGMEISEEMRTLKSGLYKLASEPDKAKAAAQKKLITDRMKALYEEQSRQRKTAKGRQP